MKKKVLSIMMAAAMTLSVSAFATTVTAVNNTTTVFAETNLPLNLSVEATHLIWGNNDYEGRACVGDTIHYNAVANGGSDVKYDVSISRRNSMGYGNESYTNLSGAGDMSWTPEYTGLYQITITAKNTVTGATESKYLHYSISPKLEVTSLTGNNETGHNLQAKVGDRINVKATSMGGAGYVSYTFRVTPRYGRFNSSYSYVSTDGTFLWVPLLSAFYQIDVTAKDQFGNEAYETMHYSVTNK